jgi:SAM-dependent methyltransferase
VFEMLALVVIITLCTATGGFLSMPKLIALLIVEVGAFPGVWLLAHKAPPYVPTTKERVQLMMKLAGVQPGDKAFDLGCGDGRLVFAAGKLGADAVGYELSVPTFLIAKVRSLFFPNSSIRFGNYTKRGYRDADAIFCFLLSKPMEDFYREIWPTLKPGCRVVSNTFPIKPLTADCEEKGTYLYVKTQNN